MSDKKAKCVLTEHTTTNGHTKIINNLQADYFGAKLKHIRKERKLSQSAIAEALGVSQGAISYWENGTKLPDLNTFWLLCQFLDVEPSYLMGSYRNITASTGLSDEALRVLNEWQNNTAPSWLVVDDLDYHSYNDIDINEKKPSVRAEVLNKLCFKYPDIFGQILDKLVAFMLSDKDILKVFNSKNKNVPKDERVFFCYSDKLLEYYNNYAGDKLPHVTLDIDTIKQFTQLEIMELLRDLRAAATKENNTK